MKKIPVRQIRHSPEEDTLWQGFRIRRLADILAGNAMVEELHRHDFFFMLILGKGSGLHAIDFADYPVEDHSVFILRPGQVHRLCLEPGSTGYLAEISKDFYSAGTQPPNKLLRMASRRNVCRAQPADFPILAELMDRIFREYTGRQEGYREIIRACLDIFFIELLRLRKNTMPDAVTDPYMQERLEEFLQLLETRIFTHKQVADYTGMLNLSAYQLNAITKASLGKTASALIDEQIILEARRLLLATPGQVKEIAYTLGYDDASYFIRFFKKHTGLSPEAFRKNFK